MKKYLIAALIFALPITAYFTFVKRHIPSVSKDATTENEKKQALKADSSARAAIKRGEISAVQQSRNEEAELEADSLVEALTARDEEINENTATAKEMFAKVVEAASRGDRAFLKEIPKNDPSCKWCNAYYDMAIQAVRSGELRSDMRAFLALSLTQSGNPANVRAVVDAFNAASNAAPAPAGSSAQNSGQVQNVSSIQGEAISAAPAIPDSSSLQDSDPSAVTVLGRTLEDADLINSDIEIIASNLNSENPYEREAAVSILTKNGSLEAAQELYRHTVERGDPSGYYRSGMGLGNMTPEAGALDYLEGLAKNNDEYSHLAVKALLNYGREGVDRVVNLLGSSHDAISASKILRSGVDHIPHDRETIAYMQRLSVSSPNTAIQELAKAVIREKEIEDKSFQKEFEYNENFEAGLVENDPAPAP